MQTRNQWMSDMRTCIQRMTIALLLIGATALGITPAFGQSECNLALTEANKYYEMGNFNGVIALLTPCLQEGFSNREKVQAYQLLAKTYLATDYIEEAEKAIQELLRINENFEANIFDPPVFIRMVNDAKRGMFRVKVTSVSKKAEDLLEAPATVILLTEKEIKQRGYTDLEQILYDLPGFDISRSSGAVYSHFHQRGYNSVNPDRTIVQIDGVEENDLWSNIAWYTRQYPISNISRIEVVYGPASTIYGANAFLGVINIITKEPLEILDDEQQIGVDAHIGGGSWNTQYADITVAGQYSNAAFTLTGRYFKTDEMDLSHTEDWDYALHDRDYYRDLLTVGGGAVKQMLQDIPYENPQYYTINADSTLLTPTDYAVDLARDFDEAALNETVGGHPIEFSDYADNWLLNGKLKLSDITFGFQWWHVAEGNTWTTDEVSAGADNGNVWKPKQYFVYGRYEKQLTEQIAIMNYTRFKAHSLSHDNATVSFRNYSTGRLDWFDLLDHQASFWDSTYFFQISKQLRTEFKIIYAPNPDLDIVAGLEYRNSTLQGNYIRADIPTPEENADPITSIPGSNYFDYKDFGFYSQGTYRPLSWFKFTVGGRIDNNQIRQNGGYGTVFNPRLAVVFTPKTYIFKVIYSEAFKDAASYQKYATTTGRELNNPTLEPEEVQNIEASLGWRIRKGLFVDVAAYSAFYSKVVGTREVQLPGGQTTTRYEGIGELEIRGLQANFNYTKGNYNLFGNYTYTSPFNTRPLDDRGEPLTDQNGNTVDELRIANIASHQINLGGNFLLRDRINLNLRMNYVGDRKTGENTTVPTSPYNKIDSYTIFNGAVTYQNLFPGTSLQLIVNNILDKEYYHPGVRAANYPFFAARKLQNERQFVLRLMYEF